MSREELERRKKKHLLTTRLLILFVSGWVQSLIGCVSHGAVSLDQTPIIWPMILAPVHCKIIVQEDWKIFFFFFFPDHQRDCCFKTQWAFIAFVFYFLETLPKFWQMQIVMVSDICLAHYPRGSLKCCEIFSWRSFYSSYSSFSFILREVQREGKEI